MTKQRWVPISLMGILVLVFSTVNAIEAQAAEAGGPCYPGATNPSLKCPAHYTCNKETRMCECAWGALEVGLLTIEKDVSICALIAGQGGGAGALRWFIQQAVTAVMALTIMAAVVSIVIGGYIYMTAGGDADRVRTAKVWIGSAILGIILALLAWLILRSIATNLVEFPTPTSSSTPTSSPAATSMGAP